MPFEVFSSPTHTHRLRWCNRNATYNYKREGSSTTTYSIYTDVVMRFSSLFEWWNLPNTARTGGGKNPKWVRYWLNDPAAGKKELEVFRVSGPGLGFPISREPSRKMKRTLLRRRLCHVGQQEDGTTRQSQQSRRKTIKTKFRRRSFKIGIGPFLSFPPRKTVRKMALNVTRTGRLD